MVQHYVYVDDIKEALRRRGPDSLGTKKICVYPSICSDEEPQRVISVIQGGLGCDVGSLRCGELEFVGATLQLRGITPLTQPLVDSCGNVLVYNGMVFEVM